MAEPEGYRNHEYRDIAETERLRSMAEIERWPDPVKQDAHGLWVAIQEATNQYVASVDRALDERTVPMVLRLMIDEFERIIARGKTRGGE